MACTTIGSCCRMKSRQRIKIEPMKYPLISAAMRAAWKEGRRQYNPASNAVVTERKREAMREVVNAYNATRFGENHPRWKGGFDRKAYMLKWNRENREMKNFHTAQREAILKGAMGSHTFEEWIEVKKQFGNRCAMCGIHESEAPLTQDHIVAITKGGTNDIGNIQPLCRSCNSRKGNR